MVILNLNPNVKIDRQLKSKLDSSTLDPSDVIMLELGNFLAETFPKAKVYLGGQQQGIQRPSCFVNLYSIHSEKRMENTGEYEFGFDLAYLPENDNVSSPEMNAAIYQMETLESFQSDLGVFSCYSKDSNVTDGIAHISGIVRMWEQKVNTDPVIQHVNKEMII